MNAELFDLSAPTEDVDQRYTTRETMAWCEKAAGVDGWDLDAAACDESHKADRYFTVAEDGLRQPWFGRCWVNPPYSDIAPWVRRAWAEAGHCEVIAMLIPASRTEQPFWQTYVEPHRDRPVVSGAIGLRTHFLPGRQSFALPGSGGIGIGSPPFGVVLLVWRRQ